MLHVRIDDKTKLEASRALSSMGLSMSQAIRIFLHRVAADQAFPLELKIPNAETRAAMAEAEGMIHTGQTRDLTATALFKDLEKSRIS
jgi:DNA-damage-inducible protein J